MARNNINPEKFIAWMQSKYPINVKKTTGQIDDTDFKGFTDVQKDSLSGGKFVPNKPVYNIISNETEIKISNEKLLENPHTGI